MDKTPIFPLSTPLLPGCVLPLQIFEQRYLSMVSDCMKKGSGFVVTLLKEGTEVERGGQRVNFADFGCLGTITDFGQKENGLLTIEVTGATRVELSNIEKSEAGLWLGDYKEMPERGVPDEESLEALKLLLSRLLDHEMMQGIQKHVNLESSIEVMNYLIMLLPLPPMQKQGLLETDNLELRWYNLLMAITRLEEKANS